MRSSVGAVTATVWSHIAARPLSCSAMASMATSEGVEGSNFKTSSNVYTLKKLSKPKVSKKSKKYIRVKWTNIQGETGYQIYRSTKKSKGFKLVKTVKSTYAKSTAIKTTRKKTYYYKIRAYKTVNGKKIYGPWSAAVKFKR